MILGALTDHQVNVVIGIAGAAATLGAVIVTAVLARWSDATNRRRDRYSAAVETLVAWCEYPYRVRRRTSDAVEELARLAELGHDLQQRLRCHETWIATESHFAARVFGETLDDISGLVAPATTEAWASPPVTAAAGMNLDGWGPGRSTIVRVERLRSAIECRFGWRRLCGPLHPGVQRRAPSNFARN